MSRISRDIFTQLDLNGPYLRIDSQPQDITKESVFGNSAPGRESRYTATFTVAVSTYYMTGDEADTGDRTIIEEDAVPPTVDNSGSIAYQWYEQRGASQDIDNDIRLRNGIDDTTGVDTPTLSITNLQSPSDNQRKFYCYIDYVPSQYETGNAVNETLTTSTATLTVLPYIIIDTQPQDVVGYINNNTIISLSARLSDTFFTDDLTYQWYEVPEGQELTPNIINDGTFTVNTVNTSINTEDIIENLIKEETFVERVPYTRGGSRTISKQVGIPTEAVEVKFKIAGGSGGSGGDESSSWIGGSGGLGRYGEFKFSDDVITAIRNNTNNERTKVIINAGRNGNDGPSNTSDSTSIGNGGSCAIEFLQQRDPLDPQSILDLVQGSAGDGGFAGPNGTSGAGGGGGGCSSIQLEVTNTTEYVGEEDGVIINGTFSSRDFVNIGVAGGGGGGGGASLSANGSSGGTGDPFSIFSKTELRSDIQQATSVNFNPSCSASNTNINIEYGFYTKTATAKSDLVGASPDRLVIIWDGNVVYDRPKAQISVQNDSEGYYIQVGNTKYYASAHRSSLLGWCDDNSCGTCTRLATEAQDPTFIDTPRETGGYANSFDIIRVIVAPDNLISIPIEFGGNGQDKLTGDGGGGGGAGAGAITPRDGGTAGADPVPASNAPVTVISSGNVPILGTRYIRMVPVDGGTPITFDAGNIGTREITVPAGSTWDIVSDVDDGLSSENIQLLPDLGRSVGLDVFSDGQGDFDDLVVEFSDGTFKNVSRTIFNDGQFLGRSIIQYTAPTRTVNGTVATGGQGGQSAYMQEYATKLDEGTHNGEGYVEVFIRTQKPYDQLTSTITPVSIVQKVNYSGTRTNTLTTKADYSYSSRYMCRIRSTIASPIKVLDSRIAQLVILDLTTNAITVEEIGTDGFARISAVDLDNADLFFRPSTESGSQKTEYYSFYSPTDINVDLQMFGGKGTNFNGNLGGKGGSSYMRLKMKANTEYVIAGLDEFNNTPFLYKKGNLIATVGSGGHAGRLGNGGDGGGTRQGGSTALRGALGAPLITPGTDGVIGSASAVNAISPDTKASGSNGGQTLKCTKGTYWRNQGLSPCQDISGNNQFRLADGTVVTNTASISRGFKAGYNIFNTSGEGGKTGNANRESDGGNGASGGQGSTNGYGGGGGAGYILESPDFFIRYSYFGDEDGVLPGSRVGVNDGDPYVKISKIDVPTEYLTEFNEFPDDLVLNVEDIDVDDVDVFEPNPIVTVPDPARVPNPQVKITDPAFPRGTGTVYDISEGESQTFTVETTDIPPHSRIYWRLTYSGASDADFTATQGYFDTDTANDNTTRCIGTFTVSIVDDLSTEFVNGTERFGVDLFSDSARTIRVASTPFNANFNILDTSRTPPTASVTIASLPSKGGTPITMYEGETRTFNIVTEDIPLFTKAQQDVFPNGNIRLNWEVDLVSNVQLSDFIQPSGFVDITVADPATSVSGTGSFNITTFEDFQTEEANAESAQFNINLYYSTMPTGLSTHLFRGRDSRENIRISDTSRDPVYVLTPASVTMDENASESIGGLGGDYDLDNGATETLTLNTEWVTNGSTFYYKVVAGHNNTNGTAAISSADFAISSGTFTITADTTPGTNIAGSGTFNVKTNPEGVLEGNENFTVQVHKTTDSFGNALTYPTNATLVERTNITVIDTARPYYHLVPSIIGMDENAYQAGGSNFGAGNFDLDVGDSITITLTTNYIASGTTFFYEVRDSGNSVATGQFASPSGTFTVSGDFYTSSGTFTLTTVPDGVLDGTQNYTVRVYQGTSSSDPEVTTGDTVNPGTVNYPIDIQVADTAFPKYQFTPSSASMTENGTSLTVGDTETFTLKTEYVTPGSTFFYKICNGTGNTEATSDFSPSSAQFTIASGGNNNFFNATTTFVVTTTPDGVLEGTEGFTIRVYAGPNDSSTEIASSTISVDDTAFPIYRVTKTGTVDDFSEIIDELPPNNSVTLDAYVRYPTGNSSPYPPTDPATVYWKVFKSDGVTAADAADFSGAISGNFTADTSGTNEVTISSAITLTAADDFATDSADPEVFIVKISPDSSFPDLTGTIVAHNFNLSINDTSRDPVYTITPTGSTLSEIEPTSGSPGNGGYTFTLVTTNVLIDDTLTYRVAEFANQTTDVSGRFNIINDYDPSTSVIGNWELQNLNDDNTLSRRSKATWKLRIQPVDDFFTNGDIVYTIQTLNASDGSSNNKTGSFVFTVSDNSNTPTFTISDITSLNEIDSPEKEITLTTTNVLITDTLYYEVRKNPDADAESNFVDLATSYTSNSIRGEWEYRTGNRASATWRAKIAAVDDFSTNGDQNYTIKATRNNFASSGATVLASKNFTVTDDSNTRGYTLTVPTTMNEGAETASAFTVATTNVDISDTLSYIITDSDGFEASSDFDSSSGNLSRSLLGTRATGSHTVNIKADADETSEGDKTYTFNVFNLSGGTNSVTTVVASADFIVRDTSKADATYTLGKSPDQSSYNEGTAITLTLNATNDTGGEDGRGDKINKNDEFYRFWRIFGDGFDVSQTIGQPSSYNDDINPYRGRITMTVTSETGAKDCISSQSFTVEPLEDFVDDGEKDYHVKFYGTSTDRDSDSNALADFQNAFTVKNTSKPEGYWGNSTGGVINFGTAEPYGYIVDEGSSFDAYFYTTAPAGTNFEFRLKPGPRPHAANGTAGADLDDFDLKRADTEYPSYISRQVTTEAVDYKTLDGKYRGIATLNDNKLAKVKSVAKSNFNVTADGVTENGTEEGIIQPFTQNGNSVPTKDFTGTSSANGINIDYSECPIFIKDTSITIVEGCTDDKADNYNANANNDDGTCTFSLAGSIAGIPIYRYQLPALYSVDPTASNYLDAHKYPNRIYPHWTNATEAPDTYTHKVSSNPDEDITYNYVGRVGYVVWSSRTPVVTTTDNTGSFTCGDADSICESTRDSYNFYKYSGFDYLHYAAANFHSTGAADKETDDERYWFHPDDIDPDGPNAYKVREGDLRFLSGGIKPLYCVYKEPFSKGAGGNTTVYRRHDIIYTTTPEMQTEGYDGKPSHWIYAAGSATDRQPYRYILSGPNAIMSNISVLTNTDGGDTDVRQCIIQYASDFD